MKLKTDYPALDRDDLEVDVAIIGGGITAITAGLLLQRAGRSVALIESDHIASGETGYTTAHLTQILDTRYHRLIADFGREGARQVAASHRAAIDQITALIKEYGISCAFTEVPGFLFAEGYSRAELERELDALRQVSIEAHWTDAVPLPFPTQGGIRIPEQARFHPRQYLLPLAEALVRLGGLIFEKTRMLKVRKGKPCEVTTSGGRVRARDVIVAAHVPVTNRVLLHTKLAAYRTYALGAPLEAPIPDGLYWDTADPYHYLRLHEDPELGQILIAGGEDHKTGTVTDTDHCFARLEAYARARFSLGTIAYRWSGQIIEPADGLAYIGANSLSRHIHVATGFGGNGMTYGTLAGMMLRDRIMGAHTAWDSLYDATRIHPLAAAKNYLAENKDFPVYFFKDRLHPGGAASEVASGSGAVVELNGQKAAVYRDPEGGLHALCAVCPHLGCEVHWNNAERSWDCPCHGSRFDALGKVVNGPATSDLRKMTATQTPPAPDATGHPLTT